MGAPAGREAGVATLNELSVIQVIDLLLSGMTIGLNMLLVGHLIAMKQRTPVTVTAILFCASIPFKVFAASPFIAPAMDAIMGIVQPVAQLHTVFFWWFALALFDDHFRARWYHLVPVGLIVLIGVLLAVPWGLPERTGEIAARLVTVVLMVHILSLALREYEGDLVDERRKFRVALSIALPVTVLSITVSEIYGLWRPLDPAFHLIYELTMLCLSFVFVLWITGMKDRILVSERREQTEQADVLGPADRLELIKLRRLVEAGVLLEPALTIGALADRLGMPEHRLRRIINRGLGYRNFAAFVNDHRIEEAKRRLSDPDLAREQIIQHAYALGYASLAPFNRAFRERVGISPSEYRHEALSRVEAA